MVFAWTPCCRVPGALRRIGAHVMFLSWISNKCVAAYTCDISTISASYCIFEERQQLSMCSFENEIYNLCKPHKRSYKRASNFHLKTKGPTLPCKNGKPWNTATIFNVHPLECWPNINKPQMAKSWLAPSSTEAVYIRDPNSVIIALTDALGVCARQCYATSSTTMTTKLNRFSFKFLLLSIVWWKIRTIWRTPKFDEPSQSYRC